MDRSELMALPRKQRRTACPCPCHDLTIGGAHFGQPCICKGGPENEFTEGVPMNAMYRTKQCFLVPGRAHPEQRQEGDRVMARYLVRKAPGVDGPPIPEDEPCLVIRAQDVLAVRMMRLYVDMYTLLGDYDEQVVEELNDHLDRLVEWSMEHSTKTADR